MLNTCTVGLWLRRDKHIFHDFGLGKKALLDEPLDAGVGAVLQNSVGDVCACRRLYWQTGEPCLDLLLLGVSIDDMVPAPMAL